MKKLFTTFALSLALLPASAQMWLFDSKEELEEFLLTQKFDTTTVALDEANKLLLQSINASGKAFNKASINPSLGNINNMYNAYQNYILYTKNYENEAKQLEMNRICALMKELLLKYKKEGK